MMVLNEGPSRLCMSTRYVCTQTTCSQLGPWCQGCRHKSNGTSLLEQSVQLLLLGLQVRVAANVLLGNEDVGHGGLASKVAERGLDGGTVICNK